MISFLQKHKKKHITTLRLVDCRIGDEGVEALANGNLSNLTSLYLGGNGIGERGIRALANGNLSNLTSLYLERNRIGNKSAEALANGNLINLTSLDLRHNNISCQECAEVLAKLKKRRKSGKAGSMKERYQTEIREKSQNRVREMEEMRAQPTEFMKKVKDLQEASTSKGATLQRAEEQREGVMATTASSNKSLMQCSKKFKSNEANNQGAKQQEAQTQFGQQQKPNAQATNTQQQGLSIQWFKNKSNLDLSMPCKGTLKKKSSSEPEVSTASSKKLPMRWFKKFKSNKANNQGAKQQEAQTQFGQQQKPNAQATNDSNVLPMLRSRLSSLSSSSGEDGNQAGPSNRLSEVQPISRSQSLNSLHSDDSDIEVISKSQCR